jgi:N-carbamoylputrescine amidase
MACGPDLESNRRKAYRMGKIAAEGGARIVVFQEMSCLPWFAREKNPDHFLMAEEIEGVTVQLFQSLAREEGIALVCPFFERDGESYYNTAVVVGPGAEVLGRYRKIHLPQIPFWEEKYYFSPGDLGLPVFKTPFGSIGIQLSWDNFFPEGTRILALKGAELVVAPTSAAFASHHRWEKVICANAIANNLFIFRVNRVGREEEQHFYGKSFCVDPGGEFIAEPAGLKDAIVFAEVDLEDIQKTRAVWTFFRDRRPGEYGDLLRV